MTRVVASLIIVLSALLFNVSSVCAAENHHHDHAQHQNMPMPAQVEPDHSAMQHEQMDHSQHKPQAVAPESHKHHPETVDDSEAMAQLRDPHAYAEGYDFGPYAKHHMGDDDYLGSVIMDRLESVISSRNVGLTYDWQAWFGKTNDRALIRAEGEIIDGRFENARNELLWAHAVTPFWDSQIGVRYDSGKGTDRGWLALGIQGLAPYWVYVEATGYVNEQGRTAFRLELEYDLLITQRLILQPRTELNIYSRDDVSRDVKSGLSMMELGVRLRYEIVREFAPYVGVDWERRFESSVVQTPTAGYTTINDIRFVAGVRFWF